MSKNKPRPLYVSWRRPRCPLCNSYRLRSYKTVANGDGTLTRYSKCRDCGTRLILVVE